MVIGINWKPVWKPVWKSVWRTVAPVGGGSGGGGGFAPRYKGKGSQAKKLSKLEQQILREDEEILALLAAVFTSMND